jgi:S-layer homology domain
MRFILLVILGLLSIWDTVSGATFPFTDVKESDKYYDGVRDLYEYGIIFDDGTGLFRPSEAITRDMFVGLSISVSCQKCLSPSIDDILHYSISPFIDLEKRNPYFYCIA